MFRPVIASTFPLNQIITCHKPLNRHTFNDNRIADHGSDCWVVTQAFSAERSNLVGIEQLFLKFPHCGTASLLMRRCFHQLLDRQPWLPRATSPRAMYD